MDSYKFQKECKEYLVRYYEQKIGIKIGIEDCYVVWSCKTLQNNKALIITNVSDGRYVEFTYNGDKNEVYMDVYKKKKHYILRGE